MSGESVTPLFIVMMKHPSPGAVKTRLVNDGFSAEAAAAIAREMARCIAHRLAARGPIVLGVSPDGCGEELATLLDLELAPNAPNQVRAVDQGSGDLGARLDRVWRAVGRDTPVAFFGIDSPDVSDAHLDAIGEGLANHDLAVGPTEDGGYWTLAAARYLPQVLAEIDWGGPTVYETTLQRAEAAGLTVRRLESWPDVDFRADVEALRRRLKQPTATLDEPCARLAERLSRAELRPGE